MGEIYKMGENPIRDYFINLLQMGVDISDENMGDTTHGVTSYILSHAGVIEDDLKYLDFSIIREIDNRYKIIPDNIVSALWFLFKFPLNCDLAYRNNKTVINDIEYFFNNETKELKWKKRNL